MGYEPVLDVISKELVTVQDNCLTLQIRLIAHALIMVLRVPHAT